LAAPSRSAYVLTGDASLPTGAVEI